MIPADAKVDDLQRFQSEIAQIVLDSASEFVATARPARIYPRRVLAPTLVTITRSSG